MGHVLSFTHCKDAPSTASSTPDSCPPDGDLDDLTVTPVDLWPPPSPHEPTFSYITVGSSSPLTRPPARARRGRGQIKAPITRREGPEEEVVTYVLLEKVCQLTQALPPQIQEEVEFVAKPQPQRIDFSADMEERREDRQYKKEEKKEGQKMTRMLRTPLDIRINVKDLLYWRDTLLSAGCLTGVTLSLLCLSQFSVISVLSYGCLIVLSATLALRLYTQLMHALKRGSGANPFQQYLDADLTLSTQQVEAITARALSVFCSTAGTLRSLFLVQDVRESLKFLVLLYLLTYVGAVFNGLTLLLLCVIGAFTFPILYKQHQTQVDCYVSLVSKKLNGIRASVRALFKKPAAKQK